MNLSGVGAAIASKLKSRTGTEWTYNRGITSDTITFYKSEQPPQVMSNDKGEIIEVILATFRGLTADLSAFGFKPQDGDRITDGTSVFEVRPLVDKCYYTVGGMVHIHAVQKS